jgi:hypothetical protein
MTASEIIAKTSRKNEIGFTGVEIRLMLLENNIDVDKFYDALGVNTCAMIDGQIITYFWDVENALDRVLNDRDITLDEWD